MTEEELREFLRNNFAERELREGQYCAYREIADDYPDTGMEDELLVGIIKNEMSRHHILY